MGAHADGPRLAPRTISARLTHPRVLRRWTSSESLEVRHARCTTRQRRARPAGALAKGKGRVRSDRLMDRLIGCRHRRRRQASRRPVATLGLDGRALLGELGERRGDGAAVEPRLLSDLTGGLGLRLDRFEDGLAGPSAWGAGPPTARGINSPGPCAPSASRRLSLVA